MAAARVESLPLGTPMGAPFDREVLLEKGMKTVTDAYKTHGEVCYLQLAWIVLKSNLQVAADLARFEVKLRAQSWLQWLRGDKPDGVRTDPTTNLLPWIGGKPWMKQSSLYGSHPKWWPVHLWAPKPRKKDVAYYLDALLEMAKEMRFDQKYRMPAVPSPLAQA